MYRKNGKRVIALLLGLLLAFAVLPMTKPALADGDVDINDTNFPDAVFRAYVQNEFDKDSNGKLSQEELDNVEYIVVTGKGISDLKGVENFTNLLQLRCDKNNLTSLDISKNTELYDFDCSENKLTSLDVSKNTRLNSLACAENQLSALNLSSNTSLDQFCCEKNQLTSLDVTKNLVLRNFHCGSNQLTSLDVRQNTKLQAILCEQNKLKNLDVSNNRELMGLFFNNNQITNLDVSNNPKFCNLDGDGQEYHINVSGGNLEFDLSSLPGNFDPSKASDWKHGSVSGNTLTLESGDVRRVTYIYTPKEGYPFKVTLINDEVQPIPVKVTFDSNGGTGTMDPVDLEKGQDYTLPSNGFTPPVGKVFKAWEIDGKEIAPEKSIEVDADTTVKALWKTPSTNNGGSSNTDGETNNGGNTEQGAADKPPVIHIGNEGGFSPADGIIYPSEGDRHSNKDHNPVDFRVSREESKLPEKPLNIEQPVAMEEPTTVVAENKETVSSNPGTGDPFSLGMVTAFLGWASLGLSYAEKRKNNH